MSLARMTAASFCGSSAAEAAKDKANSRNMLLKKNSCPTQTAVLVIGLVILRTAHFAVVAL